MRPVGQKVESANESSGFGRTHVVDKSEKVDSFLYILTHLPCICSYKTYTYTHTYNSYIFLPQKTHGSLVERSENTEKYKEDNLSPHRSGNLQHCSVLSDSPRLAHTDVWGGRVTLLLSLCVHVRLASLSPGCSPSSCFSLQFFPCMSAFLTCSP